MSVGPIARSSSSFLLFRLLVACAWLAVVLGCSSNRNYVWASQLPPTDPNAARILRPGDRIQVVVAAQETLSGEFDIRPSGDVALPAAGSLSAKGKTSEQLAFELTNRLRGVLAQPHVTVLIVSRRPANVSVLGEVKTPGHFPLADGEGLLDVLARAGGLTTFADEDAIFVIRRGQPSPRVRFRYGDLVSAEPGSVRYLLQNGDVVVVE